MRTDAIIWAHVVAVVCTLPGNVFGESPQVIREEIVTRFAAANNGAGPLWCYASPLLVRDGKEVYVSIIETGQDVPPLCNTRFQLWKRLDTSWRAIATEQSYRQREPCPLAFLPGRGLFVSTNPSLTEPGTRYRACLPTVFQLRDQPQGMLATRELPVWSERANFNDHSYRGFAADRTSGELLLLNIDTKTSEQFVSLRKSDATWIPRGKIVFPIRAAYPNVAIRDGAAHVMAIGDIREPVEQWQQLKREVLNREWDYVFRRLFYAWSADIREGTFGPPIEVDSVEQTGGHILNLDILVDQQGDAHLLYLKQPHQHAFLRDRYFPGQPMTKSLMYVVLTRGRVVERTTLAETPLSGEGFEPTYARFHVAPNEVVSVVLAGTLQSTSGTPEFVNLVQQIRPAKPAVKLELTHPFRTFFVNTPRGGSQPSRTLDLFGTSDDVPNLRYAEIELR